jgi:TatD DNase family protein
MLVDHHCHLDFPDFEAELDAVVERARANGVTTLVTISTRIKQFEKLQSIVERYDDVFCSVGTHPHNADEEKDLPVAAILERAKHPKVVAIGEAGLDYFYKRSTPENQAAGFRRHIQAARQTGLPLEIHTRDADADTLAILEDEHKAGAFPAVLH